MITNKQTLTKRDSGTQIQYNLTLEELFRRLASKKWELIE